MSKIIFVGDVHLKGSSPISRKDNYSETILNKLRFINDYAHSIDCTTFIFLGDIFDTVNTSLQYFSHCLTLFKEIKESGIDIYTIVGNHDLKYDSMDTLPVTPLGILVKSDAIQILDSLTVDDVYIKGCHFPESPQPNTQSDLYSILLLHRFYESGFNETPITKEDAIDLGYDTYILGHDHRPYHTVEIETDTQSIKVLRPGSLARNSSEQYNRLRKPRILILDTDTKLFHYEEVPSESGMDIFFEKQAEEQLVSMKELVDYLKSSYHTADSSIRDFVKNTDIPEDVKSLINTYLDLLGA